MYIKATQTKCEAYRLEVNAGENWQGTTNNWETPVEIEGNWYINYHENYPTELELVDEKPKIEEDLI